MDRKAWRFAVHGVKKSRTQLSDWARDPVEVAGPLGTPLGLAQRKRASPNPGIEPGSPARQANSLPAELPGNFLGDFFFLGG